MPIGGDNSGFDFSCEDLSGEILSGNFTGADFRCADLTGAELSGIFVNADFRGTHLQETDCRDKRFAGATFGDCDCGDCCKEKTD